MKESHFKKLANAVLDAWPIDLLRLGRNLGPSRHLRSGQEATWSLRSDCRPARGLHPRTHASCLAGWVASTTGWIWVSLARHVLVLSGHDS
jgi:hypothetical protein